MYRIERYLNIVATMRRKNVHILKYTNVHITN